MEELAKYLRALLLLQISTLPEDTAKSGRAVPKVDVLLADAGFSQKEISDMLGKSGAAVAKAIYRARAARRTLDSAESPGQGEQNG